MNKIQLTEQATHPYMQMPVETPKGWKVHSVSLNSRNEIKVNLIKINTHSYNCKCSLANCIEANKALKERVYV